MNYFQLKPQAWPTQSQYLPTKYSHLSPGFIVSLGPCFKLNEWVCHDLIIHGQLLIIFKRERKGKGSFKYWLGWELMLPLNRTRAQINTWMLSIFMVLATMIIDHNDMVIKGLINSLFLESDYLTLLSGKDCNHLSTLFNFVIIKQWHAQLESIMGLKFWVLRLTNKYSVEP